jgi:hypothetical protein
MTKPIANPQPETGPLVVTVRTKGKVDEDFYLGTELQRKIFERKFPGAESGLHATAWRDGKRPGHYFKNYWDKPSWTYFCMARHCECQECRTPWPAIYMVQDHIWKSAYPESGITCQDCLENRLGRMLGLGDLIDVPANKEQIEALGGPSVLEGLDGPVHPAVLTNHLANVAEWHERFERRKSELGLP